jgi:copper(I)-binding protein
MTTTTTTTTTMTAVSVSEARTRAVEFVRAAVAPLVTGALLLTLLWAWVADGGFGTIARVRLQITGAIVPLPATPDATAAYLTIRNTGAAADELLSVSTASAQRAMLTNNAATSGTAAGSMAELKGITVPAHGTVVLGPYADDIMLMQPKKLAVGQSVVLDLDFRTLGQVTVDAKVAPLGSD